MTTLPFLAVLASVSAQTGLIGASLTAGLVLQRRLALLLLYALRVTLDRGAMNGTQTPSAWFRSSLFWQKYAEFFKASIVKTHDLSPEKTYLFGCHPHGIVALSGPCMWGSEATQFSAKFPHIRRAIGVVNFGLICPVAREFAVGTGCISADRPSVEQALKSGTSVVLYPGGACEALVAGSADGVNLVLRDRFGFVKLALETGASLVPSFTFGENDAFEQVTSDKLRKTQIKLMKLFGFSLPLIKPYNPLLPIVPKQVNLTTVVGAPIDVAKMEKSDPRFNDEVRRLHARYIVELVALHATHKATYGSASEQHLQIIGAEDVKSAKSGPISSKL